MIIEDDNFLLSLIVEKFIQLGFDAEAASDGEEGLNKILNNKYDLVLLDMILPKMDGFKVLENVKKNQTLKDLPIVVTSNLYDKNDIDRAVSLGAADYIIKAYNSPENIVDRVRAFYKKLKLKNKNMSKLKSIVIGVIILDLILVFPVMLSYQKVGEWLKVRVAQGGSPEVFVTLLVEITLLTVTAIVAFLVSRIFKGTPFQGALYLIGWEFFCTE